MKTRHAILSALLLAAPPPRAAAAAEPVELLTLRESFLADARERSAAAEASWRLGMETLEKQRAAAGDYEGAIRVRKALSERLDAGASPAARIAGAGSLSLNPATALQGGGAEFTDVRKTSLRLKRPGSNAVWTLTSPPAGVYEVRLTYGAPGENPATPAGEANGTPEIWRAEAEAWKPGGAESAKAGGVAEFRRVTNIQSDQTPLVRVIRPTGGWGNPVTLPMGPVELDGRTVRFSLKALSAEAAGLMDLQAVELVPAALAGVSAADPADTREFLRLKEIFERQAAEKTKTLTRKYLSALQEMESRFSRGKDTAGLAEARQERLGLEKGGTENAQEGEGVTLPVADPLNMTLRGEVKLSSQRDFLTKFRPAGTCEIRWKLPALGIGPGSYEVTLEVRLTPGSGEGGTAVLFSASPAAGNGPELPLSVEGPPAAGTPRQKDAVRRTLRPGRITVSKGSEELVLRVLTLARADGSLFDLESVRLLPSEESPP